MSTAAVAQLSPRQTEDVVGIAIARLRIRDRVGNVHAWRQSARPAQMPPPGDWSIWYILGGRGGGKTWTSAHAFAEMVIEDPGEYAVVAPTFSAAVSVCIEGSSGLLAALATSRAEVDRGASRYVISWNRSRGELRLRNGSIVYVESAEEGAPDIQGHNLKGAWASEIALWGRRWRMAWEESIRYAVRLGRARIIADGTPKRGHGLAQMLVADPSVPKSRLRTRDNLENLNPAIVQQWQRLYGGSALGRQELEGELLEDMPGASWLRAWIDDARILPDEEGGFTEPIPAFTRVVVGIDPATTSTEGADATGIVAAAEAMHGADQHEDKPHPHYYVLEDVSARVTPGVWADRAMALYRRRRADRIVGETNRGGEMIGHTLRTVDPNVSYRAVRAMRGKTVRAEPVAALYEQGKVHHVGYFVELEDQMCSYVQGDTGSPDRMDALVWALTDLAIKDEPGLLGMYRSQAQTKAEKAAADAATAKEQNHAAA